MLIKNYAIVKLYRDEHRRWIILGQCNDLPGGVRPHDIWPIIGVFNHDEQIVEEIPRARAEGFISQDEKFAYIYLKFLQRAIGEIVTVVDDVRVEVNGVRIS